MFIFRENEEFAIIIFILLSHLCVYRYEIEPNSKSRIPQRCGLKSCTCMSPSLACPHNVMLSISASFIYDFSCLLKINIFQYQKEMFVISHEHFTCCTNIVHDSIEIFQNKKKNVMG